MRDYRWGIFLNPTDQETQHSLCVKGQSRSGTYWRARRQPAPHHRHTRRYRARIGGATQHHLGLTAPSMYDLRNLFQGQCGRRPPSLGHGLPAAQTFGRDGREEAEACWSARAAMKNNLAFWRLQRKTPDWLAFFMFTCFTDRDPENSSSQRWPNPRSTAGAHHQIHADRRGHHMLSASPGVSRVLARTCQGHERTQDRR